FAVSRYRIERTGLVDHSFARLAIIAAGGGKHETTDASPLGEFSQTDTCTMVNVVGKPWPQIAKRIVGQGRQMKDPVKAGKTICRRITRVLACGWHVPQLPPG